MRKRFFRWLRIIAIGLVGLIALLAGGVYIASELRLNRTYTINAEPLTIPNDPATIVRGQHVTVTRGGCRECHGANLAGKVLSDDPLIGRVVAPNLTGARAVLAANTPMPTGSVRSATPSTKMVSRSESCRSMTISGLRPTTWPRSSRM